MSDSSKNASADDNDGITNKTNTNGAAAAKNTFRGVMPPVRSPAELAAAKAEKETAGKTNPDNAIPVAPEPDAEPEDEDLKSATAKKAEVAAASNGRVKVHDLYRSVGARLFLCPGDLHHPAEIGYGTQAGLSVEDIQAALDTDGNDVSRYCWVLDDDVVVIDVDMHGTVDGMASFRRLCDDLGVMLMKYCRATVRTPRGGLHLCFRVPKGLKLRAIDSKVYPGIDTLGGAIKKSSLVIAAGSTHKLVPGVKYRFLEGSPELVDAPEKLMALLRVPEVSAAARPRAFDVRPENEGKPGDLFARDREGVKYIYDIMVEMGYEFWKASDEDGSEFLKFNRPGKASNSDCSGHLGKRSNGGLYQLTCFSLSDPHFDSGRSITILEALRRLRGADGIKDVIGEIVKAGKGGGPNPEEAFGVVERTAVDVFKSITQQKHFMKSEEGVKYFIEEIQKLDTFECIQGDVLTADSELTPEEFAHRHRAMSKDADLYGRMENIQVERGDDINDVLARMRVAHRPGHSMFLIDSMYPLLPENINENDNAAIGRLMRDICWTAQELDVAIVIVHHATKGDQSNKNVADVGSGAGSFARAAGSHIILRPHAKDDNLAVMEAICRSFRSVNPVSLRFSWPNWTAEISTEAVVAKAKDKDTEKSDARVRAKILTQLRDYDVVSRSQLVARVAKWKGIKRICGLMIRAGESGAA